MVSLVNVCFASDQEIEFKILEKGDVSGYCEEAYFVVKNVADWVIVWERHTSIREPKEPPPSINFSANFVVCAFMGQRPTTCYSIDVDRIWTNGELVFVEIVKHVPHKGFATGQIITYPYVMVLMEKTDMSFVFNITDEEVPKSIVTEFSSSALWIILIVVFMMFLVLKAKNCK